MTGFPTHVVMFLNAATCYCLHKTSSRTVRQRY